MPEADAKEVFWIRVISFFSESVEKTWTLKPFFTSGQCLMLALCFAFRS